MRTLTTITTTLCLLLIGTVHAAAFNDIDASQYTNAILYLQERTIVNGYADGSFKPAATINRAEFLKILMNVQYPGITPFDLRCFNDLKVKTPQWYAGPVCLAQQLGIVQGYPDGTFRPSQTVNLVEALTMTFNTFGIQTEPGAGLWYQPLLTETRTRGILTPLLTTPAHLLRRGEMASMIASIISAANQSIPDTATGSVTSTCGNGMHEGREECDLGTQNGQPGSGCSTLCLSLVDAPRRGLLSIEQRTTDVAPVVAAGQRDQTLFSFTAVAGRQDVRLNRISFSADVGSLLYGRNYRLLVNRTGGGTYTMVQESGTVDKDHLTFDHLSGGSGVIIPVGILVPFIVVADLPPDLGPVTLRLKFATDLPAYVEAQDALDGLELEGVSTNGICTAPNCFVLVQTTPVSSLDITRAGSLTVTKDLLPVRSHIIVAGSRSPELLRLRFRADGENIEVHSLAIDGITGDVDSLQFYKLPPGQQLNTDRDTPFARATSAQCFVSTPTRACANLGVSMLVLAPGEEAVIAVTATLLSDQMGGRSGDAITLSLSSAIDSAGHAIEAAGASSKHTLDQNDGTSGTTGKILIGTSVSGPNSTIQGSTNRTAFASISAIVRDGPATDYVPTGSATIGTFRISAIPSTNNFMGTKDVRLTSLVFQVTAQNILLDPAGFALSTKDNPAITAPCTASASTGTIQVTCARLGEGTIDNHVPPGGSATFQLHANIVNPQVNGYTLSILQTSIPVLGQSTLTNSVLWSDASTNFTWVDVPVTNVQGTEMRSR